MFRVQVYRGDNLAAGARLALRNRLYVSGWSLSGHYVDMMNDQEDGEIAIGFLDGEPICAVVSDLGQVMAFCRKALRRRGYTSACLAKLNTDGQVCETGVTGSEAFWRKNGIKFRWTWMNK